MAQRESRIYLLRHGETEWSQAGKHTGRSDIPLTTHGEQQARRAGGVLSALRATSVPPAMVLSSPRLRATRTAELAGLIVDETTEDLAEWDYGEYEGLTTEQIRQKIPQWTVWSHPVPGGENADQISKRAQSIVDTVRSALHRGDVVLIGHGHFTRALIASWLELDVSEGQRFNVDPAAVTVLGHEHEARQLRALNVLPIIPDD